MAKQTANKGSKATRVHYRVNTTETESIQTKRMETRQGKTGDTRKAVKLHLNQETAQQHEHEQQEHDDTQKSFSFISLIT